MINTMWSNKTERLRSALYVWKSNEVKNTIIVYESRILENISKRAIIATEIPLKISVPPAPIHKLRRITQYVQTFATFNLS